MSDTVVQGPSGRTAAGAAEDRRTERLLWWLAVAGAATSVVIGVMLVAWPRATLYLGAILFGLWLIVQGLVGIVRAVTATGVDGAGMRALEGVLGLIFVGAGIVCLRHLLLSILATATVIGLTWIIGGIVRGAAAFTPRYSGAARIGVGVLGALTAIGGVVVLSWPKLSLLAMVVFTGIWMIIMGLAQLFLVLRLRETA
ncbi:HdeD family acid-resistance protein [Paractinoplanes lichenicola]|uniref:DUF308 domain-containing protein n=1 Tax=Paractinoplanes lichenicola TaxID=2802976 RepID=A0ABS1W016_9ACTN|nr:DUF308 domain-containing protein [Actinoplanes lichenicola]MBL7260076.1 DUF308 domain-containing protein [Actinoplanes lichenicola]